MKLQSITYETTKYLSKRSLIILDTVHDLINLSAEKIIENIFYSF